MILPFSSKDHLQSWLTREDLQAGYVMPIEKCWQLAQRWYPRRAERDWQRPNAKGVFESLGLTGSFWQVG